MRTPLPPHLPGRSPRRRRLLALAAALLPLPFAGSCRGDAGAGSGGDAATGGTVVVGTAADAHDIFPPLAADMTGSAVRDQIYERLAEIPGNLNTIGDEGYAPRLARRWTWAADSLSIAFALDPRARFHDGQPVRASDVRFSYRLNVDPKVASPNAPLLANVDSVSVRDSLTAVVFFKKREPEQFYSFVYNVHIVPEHVFRDVPLEQIRTAEATRKGIGTGRFRLVRWDPGQRIEIVADTASYRGRAKLDRVIWTIVPDAGTALTQLLTGQSDVLEIVPPDQLAKVDSAAGAHTVPYPNLGYTYLGMNLRDPKNPSRPHPIFSDRQVRRALSMAVDRRAMLRNVFGATGHMSYGPFPRSLPVADTTLWLLPYDTTAARALLDSAGWREPSPGAVRQKNGRPLRFTLLVSTASRPRMSYAVLLQEALRRVGAQVDLDQIQGSAFGARQMSRDFEAGLLSWSTDPSPGGLKQSWATAGMQQGGQNFVNYSNPAVDALLDSASSAFSFGRARGYASRAFQTIVDDAPGIWLYDLLTIAGAHRRIDIVGSRADGWWEGMADWTIAPAKRIDRDRIGLGAKPQ